MRADSLILPTTEEGRDFVISVKKNKKERNSVEKFCVSSLHRVLLAKEKQQ